MTNGVYKATTGRVLSRLEERFSVPIFQGLRRDLTKKDATGELEEHFEQEGFGATDERDGKSTVRFPRESMTHWGSRS